MSECACGTTFRIEGCDLRTGIVRTILRPTSADWQTILNRVGRGTLNLVTKDVRARDIFPHLTSVYVLRLEGGDATEENPVVEFAGIVDQFDASDNGGTAVGMVSIEEYLFHRMIDERTIYMGQPTTQIAAALVGLAGPDGIPLTGVGAPSIHTQDRVYEAWDRRWIGEVLVELSDSEGGPSWSLEHTKTDGAWATRMVFQDTVGVVRDLTVKSNREAAGYSLRVDAADHATLVDAIGEGDEAGQLIARAEDPTGYYPRFDATPPFKDTAILATLQAQADGYLADNRDPVALPTAVVTGLAPDPRLMRNGDTITVDTDFGSVTYKGQGRILSTSWSIGLDQPVTRTYELFPVTRASESVLNQESTEDCVDCGPAENVILSPMITLPHDGQTVDDTTPRILGIGEPGSLIEVFIDGVSVGSMVITSGGTWVVEVVDELDPGSHEITATQTNVDATTEAATPVTFTIPEPPPPLPEPPVIITPTQAVQLVAAPSYRGEIVGASPQWGDTDDTTYAEMESQWGTSYLNRYQGAQTSILMQPALVSDPLARVAVWFKLILGSHPYGMNPRLMGSPGSDTWCTSSLTGANGLVGPAGYTVIEMIPDFGHTMEGFLDRWQIDNFWLTITPRGAGSPDPPGGYSSLVQISEARVAIYYP